MQIIIEAFSEARFFKENGEYRQRQCMESDAWGKAYSSDANGYALFVADSFATSSDSDFSFNARNVSADIVNKAKDIVDPSKLRYCQPATLKMYLADAMGLLDAEVEKVNKEAGTGSNRRAMVLTEMGVAYVQPGRAYFTGAGHPYIAVCRKDSLRRVPFVKTRLLGGGKGSGPEPSVLSAKLEDGDTIVLATDGVLSEIEGKPDQYDEFFDNLTSDADPARKKDDIRDLLKELWPIDDFTMVLCQYRRS
jgi:hypothetical protein